MTNRPNHHPNTKNTPDKKPAKKRTHPLIRFVRNYILPMLARVQSAKEHRESEMRGIIEKKPIPETSGPSLPEKQEKKINLQTWTQEEGDTYLKECLSGKHGAAKQKEAEEFNHQTTQNNE